MEVPISYLFQVIGKQHVELMIAENERAENESKLKALSDEIESIKAELTKAPARGKRNG